MRFPALLWSHLKVGIANELQYRVNFFIQLLQSLISLAAGLIGLAVVFSYTSELGGWSRPELLMVLGIYILMGGVINTFIQPNMDRLLSEIGDGTLDFALTKPVDSQVMVSLRQINFWSLTDVIVGLVVVGVAIAQLQWRVSVWQVLGFFTALILGGILVYCFWLIVSSVAFWVIRLNDFVMVFQAIYAAGRWPVGIYPDWLRIGLTFLVPVAFAVTVPAEALTGRLTPIALLGAFGMTVLFAGLARLIWSFGVRHYSGASA
jgi:ABC-2 type transport system permease protein